MGEENLYITYRYLMAAVLGWISAQGLKYIFARYNRRSARTYRNLYISGGMPSAHSATVASVTVVIGLVEGFGSSIFALSLLLSAIVMYDAMMVRRSVGEQGEFLLKVIQKEHLDKNGLPYFARGHKPIEVLAGAVLGSIIGCIVYFTSI